MNVVIEKAVNLVGGQGKLASMCGVTQPAVYKWLNGGLVSPQRVNAIVQATKGEVKAHEIRPDLPHLFPHPNL
ncbi:helix-turn-helix domain-containing protein [Budviciaceae bacterium CWB-B4]|uniref:Helix-turn-helix domain-containing protein n=1 Tax=Limnobaculum xujianqingii TaxID=2738837 RepID=A0A9D7G0H2_9GAMM|nr:helix-turn-helix domain-containing protein [Limnobaculum xujianqingii]MBK5075200.1 helix-turn-helix domain-containing protein [Limnobaculum xujianqingii]MBK5178506.1 helix-turn-helix domain-containing protein [Limnobaculum xujianqingii]